MKPNGRVRLDFSAPDPGEVKHRWECDECNEWAVIDGRGSLRTATRLATLHLNEENHTFATILRVVRWVAQPEPTYEALP